jgi:hypothetical protein
MHIALMIEFEESKSGRSLSSCDIFFLERKKQSEESTLHKRTSSYFAQLRANKVLRQTKAPIHMICI